MPMGDNPVSQLRRLRTELRNERDAAGLTQREVADALDWSPSKLIRIERGPVGISVTDVRALLQHYGVTDKQRVEELVRQARDSKRPSWWDQYREFVSPQFTTFLAMEASSVRIRKFQGLVIPGLLQHPDYVRAILASRPIEPEMLRASIEIRLKRQELLGPDGPELVCIVDESVLHRQVGSPEVMRTQLRWLTDLQRKPYIDIRVVPFSVGVHMGMQGSFTIYELSEQQDDFAVQLELAYEDRLIQETSDETREYLSIFAELEKIALPPEQSMELVERIVAITGGES